MEGTKLLKHVKDLNLLKRVAIEKIASKETRIVGEVSIDEKLVRLAIVFPSEFPHKLPIVQFVNYIDYPLISHVFPSGAVCFADIDSVIIRSDEPIAIIRDVIKLSIDTITKGFDGSTKDDLLNDFELYWCKKSLVNMYSIINPSQKLKYIYCKGNVVGDTKADITTFFDKVGIDNKNEKSSFTQGLLIPVRNSQPMAPEKWEPYVNKWQVIAAIQKSLSTTEWRDLGLMLKALPYRLVVLQLFLPNGSYCFIGIENGSSLFVEHFWSQIIPICMERQDKAFLLERAGGNLELQTKRVVLVGCGAVGSYIAQEIAKIGIQELVLIDDDQFEANNLYRHTLGLHQNLRKSKVTALKEKLTKEIPFIEIQAFDSKIETLIKQQVLDFDAYDLVIVATGNPNTNFELNKYFLQNHKGLPILYTWLDPYGIGGHTLVSNNKKKRGCYYCLYDEDLHNEASFATPNQKFTKSLSGCSGYFVPFSALDANQVALQTIRVAIRVLLEEEQDNPIFSWKGDATSFLEKGFQVSLRYQQSTEELLQNQYGYKKEGCDVCGK